jgi:hypothetical protein
VTKEFLKAWNYSHNGVDKIEAVVLIYRKIDGSYFANALGRTNETEKFRFKWDPAAIAIAHTHPTSIDPKPSRGDMELSDRLHIPIFTMTQSGMYMYNPSVKRTIKIKEGLDWLDPSGGSMIPTRGRSLVCLFKVTVTDKTLTKDSRILSADFRMVSV